MKATVVPNRNMIMVAVAPAWAITRTLIASPAQRIHSAYQRGCQESQASTRYLEKLGE